MNKEQLYVTEFRNSFELPVNHTPTVLEQKDYLLHAGLLAEELAELTKAMREEDLVEIADAIGDLMYLALGLAAQSGIYMAPIFKEIHYSNMSKLDDNGRPIKDEGGKVVKSKKFYEPDIVTLIAEQRR